MALDERKKLKAYNNTCPMTANLQCYLAYRQHRSMKLDNDPYTILHQSIPPLVSHNTRLAGKIVLSMPRD